MCHTFPDKGQTFVILLDSAKCQEREEGMFLRGGRGSMTDLLVMIAFESDHPDY